MKKEIAEMLTGSGNIPIDAGNIREEGSVMCCLQAAEKLMEYYGDLDNSDKKGILRYVYNKYNK